MTRPKYYCALVTFIVINALLLTACNEPNTTDSHDTVWTAQEKQQLLSFSIRKLPQSAEDLSNHYQTNPQAIALGAKLFFDTRLSASGTIACATCHQPQKDFSDGLTVAEGVEKAKRNTPSLLGVSHQQWFFWDGRKDSLWAQALEPFENETEHDLSRTQLVKWVLNDPNYQPLYTALFDHYPDKSELLQWPDIASPKRDLKSLKAWKKLPMASRYKINRIFSNLGKAIAAYEATLSVKVSRFDQYLDDLKANQPSTHLSTNEETGLKLFIGKARCSSCHFSPLLSSQHFQNIGTGIPGKDMGRSRLAETQAWDVFNCLGDFSDAPASSCKELTFMNKDRHALSGSFKVPSLRNVSNTGPYFHDGRWQTLEQVVAFYVQQSSKRKASHLPSITLNTLEQAQLTAFLKAL